MASVQDVLDALDQPLALVPLYEKIHNVPPPDQPSLGGFAGLLHALYDQGAIGGRWRSCPHGLVFVYERKPPHA